jgi:hypothetical protein
MADGVDWPVEFIPDEADVYMRAHRTFFRGTMLLPGVFRSHGGGMSADWEKYSTPEETRQRANQPSENAVMCLPVAGIRDIQDLDVEHTPDRTPESPNRAHSDVLGMPDPGEDLTEVRASLLDIATMLIGL